MQSAFDQFNEHRNTLKMTTGSAELDSLIDSIQEGQFYLFYGKNKAILESASCFYQQTASQNLFVMKVSE
jgi:hypothetical protein